MRTSSIYFISTSELARIMLIKISSKDIASENISSTKNTGTKKHQRAFWQSSE